MKILKNNKTLNKIKEKLTVVGTTIVSTFLLTNSRVLAASNTQSIDAFINFACEWLTKIGGVIALVGRSYVCFGVAKRRCRGKISWINDFNGRLYVSCNCTI